MTKEDYTMALTARLRAIAPADESARLRAKARWDKVAKPLGGLGLLEDLIADAAAALGTEEISLDRRALLLLCADNGVVAEGVTQCGPEVTVQVARAAVAGKSSVCRMAKSARVDVIPVDVGMLQPVSGMLERVQARGTNNILREPAMTREQAVKTILAGMDLAVECAGRGYRMLYTGEMGIGNTTTASAMAAVLLGQSPETVTGRGSGLSDAALARKRAVVAQAIALHQPDPEDPVGVLAALGGYDIAGMAGVFLGAAQARVPVVADGVISLVAALCAARLCPAASGYILASHLPMEPAGPLLLAALCKTPVVTAGLRLGEGTGGVLLAPVLDMALALYYGTTFEQLDVEAYTPQ